MIELDVYLNFMLIDPLQPQLHNDDYLAMTIGIYSESKVTKHMEAS